VSTALGLLGVVVFVVCVIAFAAGVTWVVVRLSPARSPASKQSETT
jgi:flagellar biogenesis protein FliO